MERTVGEIVGKAPGETAGADDGYASHASLLKGITGTVAGFLDLTEGRLRFSTPDEVVFDAPLAQVTGSVGREWRRRLGAGVKPREAGALVSARPRPARHGAVLASGAPFGTLGSPLLAESASVPASRPGEGRC